MKPPAMEPPLSPHDMGPPHPESLKPHLEKVPQLPLVVDRPLPGPKPQSGGMASENEMHESAEVLQPKPQYGEWIIPYPYVTSS